MSEYWWKPFKDKFGYLPLGKDDINRPDTERILGDLTQLFSDHAALERELETVKNLANIESRDFGDVCGDQCPICGLEHECSSHKGGSLVVPLDSVNRLFARALAAERERDNYKESLRQCQETHGSSYGADWQNWKQAERRAQDATEKIERMERAIGNMHHGKNDHILEYEAEIARLKAEVKRLTIWGSDSHVTELEEHIRQLNETLESYERRISEQVKAFAPENGDTE